MFKSKEQKNADARAEIEKTLQGFLEGEDGLPEGFSDQYNRTTSSGFVLRGTPFTTYLNKIGAPLILLRIELEYQTGFIWTNQWG